LVTTSGLHSFWRLETHSLVQHRYLLYDLAKDLGEQHDLAATEPEQVRALDAQIEQFLKDTNAVIPTPNPKFDPAQYRPGLIRVQVAKEKADH
jgi:hypothetical protein